MAITLKEARDFVNQFHDAVMLQKVSAAEQAKFFLYSEAPIFVLNGEDISLQQNYEIHQKLTEEVHTPHDAWLVTQLCDHPEKARVQGTVYWQAKVKDSNQLVKCIVGEDWIIQRNERSELKFGLYINTFHHFLPDSAIVEL